MKGLPVTYPDTVSTTSNTGAQLRKGLSALLLIIGALYIADLTPFRDAAYRYQTVSGDNRVRSGALCQQAVPVLPKTYNTSSILDMKEHIITSLSSVIQVPTQTFDDMGTFGEDPRWDGIPKLHEVLETRFPLVHDKLKVTKPGAGLALIYEWKGEDPSLKPVLLTAHQDTVPVLPDSLDQWDHPPFSGFYDGESIWGRGASDTKSSLIAILTAVEHLLAQGISLQRSLIVGFGCDEEVGGPYGATLIGEYIAQTYGSDSISLLIDEGSGILTTYGQTFATPGVTEKGGVNLMISVDTLGGHSSVPPTHTAIGLLALVLAEIEKHPHTPTLPTFSPLYGFLQCSAAHAEGLPKHLRKMVFDAQGGNEAAISALPETWLNVGFDGIDRTPGQGQPLRALLSTTQATDIIQGGLKVNALPEHVTATINHRINVDSNAAQVETRMAEYLLPVAKAFDLSLERKGVHNETVFVGTKGSIIIDDDGRTSNAAPISPFSIEDPVYNLFAGTARGVWASAPHDQTETKDLIIAPFMATGNTDTRYYWNYTNNIYRFRYQRMSQSVGMHTINERTNVDDVVQMARFYAALILNFDEAKDVSTITRPVYK